VEHQGTRLGPRLLLVIAPPILYHLTFSSSSSSLALKVLFFIFSSYFFFFFLATRHSDLASSFQLLNVVVWDENRRVKDIPLGKVSLTKNFLLKQKTGIEQWMQMAPAETEGTVTGDVHLEISYYHPTSEIQTHTFSVNGWTSSSLLPSPFKYAEEPFLLTPCLTSSQLWRRETWSPETSTATPIPM